MIKTGDFPAWDDNDIQKERWAVPGKRSGAPLPTLAEGECAPWLPPSLLGRVSKLARAEDVFRSLGDAPVTIVSPSRFELQGDPDFATATEETYMRMRNIQPTVRLKEPEVSLTVCNTHLYSSETMRWIIAICSYLQREPGPNDAHTDRIWALVFPQTGGVPNVNAAGKYCVRLFWMGMWRKVTIDDLVPVDSDGRPLLPRTSIAGEIWAFLVAKAVCTLLSATGSYSAGIDQSEFGAASLIQILTGWMPETVPLEASGIPSMHADLLQLLRRHCRQPSQAAFDEGDRNTFTVLRPADSRPPSAASYQSHAPHPTRRESLTVIGSGSSTLRSNRRESLTVSSSPPSPRSPALRPETSGSSVAPASVFGSAVPSRRTSLGTELPVSYMELSLRTRLGLDLPATAGDAETEGPMINRNTAIYAFYGPECMHAAVGLPGMLSHPVRILSCDNFAAALAGQVAPPTNVLSDWVLELESPLVLYSGPLGHLHNSDVPSAARIQVAFGANFEREATFQDLCLQQRAQGVAHAPFRFRMFYKDFITIFRHVAICFKECNFSNRTHISCGADVARRRMVTVNQLTPDGEVVDTTATAAQRGMLDLSVGTPLLLHVNSTGPSEIFVVLAVSAAGNAASQQRMSWIGSTDGDAGDGVTEGIGTLTLEEFDWQSPQMGKLYLHMSTTGFKSARISLAPGRHVIRVVLASPGACSVQFWSNKDFHLDDEVAVLQRLGGCSARLVAHARTIVRTLDRMLRAEPAEATRMLRHLISAHTEFNVTLPMMTAFFTALLRTVEELCELQWFARAPGDASLTIGAAWTALCLELHADVCRTYRAIIPLRAGPSRRLTPRQAALLVQRHYRGYMGRLLASQLRAEKAVRLRAAVQSTWRLAADSPNAFGDALIRKLMDTAPDVARLLPFAEDERNRCVVTDLIGRATIATGEHAIIFAERLQPVRAVRVHLRLVYPGQDQSASLRLHVIEIATGQELTVPTGLANASIAELAPSATGYLIMVEGFAACPVDGALWGLRVMSSCELQQFQRMRPSRMSVAVSRTSGGRMSMAYSPARKSVAGLPGSLAGSEPPRVSALEAPAPSLVTSTHEGELAGGRDDVIVRLTLTPSQSWQHITAALVVRHADSPLELGLELLCNGVVTSTAIGRGSVVLPFGTLFQGDSESGTFTLIGRRLSDDAIAMQPPDRSPGAARKAKKLPQWTLQLSSLDCFSSAIDNVRATEIKATKAAWFAAPDRYERGAALRQRFLTAPIPMQEDSGVKAVRHRFLTNPIPLVTRDDSRGGSGTSPASMTASYRSETTMAASFRSDRTAPSLTSSFRTPTVEQPDEPSFGRRRSLSLTLPHSDDESRSARSSASSGGHVPAATRARLAVSSGPPTREPSPTRSPSHSRGSLAPSVDGRLSSSSPNSIYDSFRDSRDRVAKRLIGSKKVSMQLDAPDAGAHYRDRGDSTTSEQSPPAAARRDNQGRRQQNSAILQDLQHSKLAEQRRQLQDRQEVLHRLRAQESELELESDGMEGSG
eukprot:m.139588 g.139588  ORF g.139588 m.139588 type:complete len:1518 (-) comp9618_c0_seq1:4821-9374(-)